MLSLQESNGISGGDRGKDRLIPDFKTKKNLSIRSLNQQDHGSLCLIHFMDI